MQYTKPVDPQAIAITQLVPIDPNQEGLSLKERVEFASEAMEIVCNALNDRLGATNLSIDAMNVLGGLANNMSPEFIKVNATWRR